MNRVSSILGAIVVIAIGVVFVVSFQPGRGQNQVQEGPRCAAEIMGECLRGTHFWASYRLITPGGASDQFVKQLRIKAATMDGLVERELLASEAKRLGIGVSEDDISQELVNGRVHVSLPAGRLHDMSQQLGLKDDGVREVPFIDKKTNQFSPEVYRKRVTEITRLSETDFRDYQRQELIASRMRDLIRSRVRISESEAKDGYLRHRTTETVKYVLVQKKWIRDHVLDRSDKAVDAWATSHKDEIDKIFESRKAQYAAECRVAKNIFLKLDPMSKTPDEDKKKAREKLEETKKKIDGGTAFADLAAQLTEDDTNDRGGDLGCVLKGQKPKPFEDALFAMKEGDVSDVIETQVGLHLVTLVKIAKGDDALKIGRAITAKEVYEGYESERLASEGAKEILATAKGGKSLEDATKEWVTAHAMVKAGDASKAGDAPKGGKDAKDKGASGHEDKTPDGDKKGEKKDADKKGDKSADGKAPEKGDTKSPDKDADEKADAEKADEDDESGAPKVETSANFTVSGAPFDGAAPDINTGEIAFSLKKPGDLPSDVIPLDRGAGYAVIQLKERTEPTEDQWKEAKPFEVWRVRNFKQDDALAAYIKRLKSANVKPGDVHGEGFTDDPADKKAAASGQPAGQPPAPKEPPSPPQPE